MSLAIAYIDGSFFLVSLRFSFPYATISYLDFATKNRKRLGMHVLQVCSFGRMIMLKFEVKIPSSSYPMMYGT